MRYLIALLLALGCLAAVAPVDAASINATVTWGAVTGADSYVVERKVGDAAYAVVGTPTGTTFADAGLNLSTVYCYRVSAKNTAGTGPVSDEACATTMGLPGKPGNVTVIFTYTP